MNFLAAILLSAALLLGPSQQAKPSKGAAQAAAKGVAPGKPAFSGKDAFAYTNAMTQFGPRPSGSSELGRTRMFIEASLSAWKLHAEHDDFTANTPIGKIAMSNLIVKFPGKSDRIVIVAGHYDTKRFKEFKFLGANDGGSSAGVLLELARVLSVSPKKDLTVWVVFHDGEESQSGPWLDDDSLHGSKHLAIKLQNSGDVKKVAAMVNIDMIGGKNLSIMRDTLSTPWLNTLVRDAGTSAGLAKVFNGDSGDIQDDHMPYLAAGVPSVDLIDFSSQDTFWHKAGDTMDKLSADSMEAVGRVLLASIDALGKR